MADTALNEFYSRAVKIAKDNDDDTAAAAQTKQLIQAFNTLVDDPKLFIKNDITISQLLTTKLTAAQQEAFRNGITKLMQDPVDAAFSQLYATYKERRDTVATLSGGVYASYAAIYDALRTNAIELLMDKGEIAYVMQAGKRVPIHDMTIAQEDAFVQTLKDIFPQVHNVFSEMEGNIAAGFAMNKTEKVNSRYPGAQVSVNFGKLTNTGSVSRSATSEIRVPAEPGAAVLPWLMHSLDSYMMHTALAGTQSLNNHDEIANSVLKAEEMAQRINKSVWDSMLHFSPMDKLTDSFMQSLTGLKKLHEDGVIDTPQLRSVLSVLLNVPK